MTDEVVSEGRRTLGVIDGALTQLSIGILLIVPTLLAVLVNPRLLTAQLDATEDAGRRGWLLAPGPFVVLGLFAGLILISVAAPQSGGAVVVMGDGVREAAGDGQVWRAASIALPLFLAALAIAAILFVSAQIWRLKRRELTRAVRSAQYGLFGFLVVVSAAEPASLFVAPGGDNQVFEPVVLAAIGAWFTLFHMRMLSGAGDPAWRRIGAALTAAAAVAGVIGTTVYR